MVINGRVISLWKERNFCTASKSLHTMLTGGPIVPRCTVATAGKTVAGSIVKAGTV